MRSRLSDKQFQYSLTRLPDQQALQRWLAPAQVQLAGRPAVRFRRMYYDTFDWRLYRCGWVLEFDELEVRGRLRLRGRGVDAPVLEQALASVPPFPATLPPGRLRERLIKLCKLRALMLRASVDLELTPFEIRNAADKVTVRLANIRFRSNGRSRPRSIHRQLLLEPLRGYGRDAVHIREVVEQRLALEPEAEDPFERICRHDGLQPGQYQTRLNFDLVPEERSDQVLARLLLFLLDIMEVNETGIRDDIDSEFLHDFRIACRRSRTLISQVREVLPASELKRYKAVFKWLSEATGPCRDLDVFMLDLQPLAGYAGVASDTGLEVLRSLLETQRRQARADLLRTLRAKRYRRFKQDWRDWLKRAAAGECQAAQSATPVKTVADTSIWRVYKKILKDGAAIDPDTDAIALHELRKTGKKLRYLLEAFGSLYPVDDIAATVKALKKLQDNLGGIVDASVQSEKLQQIRNRLAAEAPDTDSLQTLRQLIDYCDDRHHELLDEFNYRFERFSRRKNRKRAKRLFKPG